jgi:hypothetical protein
MGEGAGRRFPPEALHNPCRCGICIQIKQDREQQAELVRLSGKTEVGAPEP